MRQGEFAVGVRSLVGAALAAVLLLPACSSAPSIDLLEVISATRAKGTATLELRQSTVMMGQAAMPVQVLVGQIDFTSGRATADGPGSTMVFADGRLLMSAAGPGVDAAAPLWMEMPDLGPFAVATAPDPFSLLDVAVFAARVVEELEPEEVDGALMAHLRAQGPMADFVPDFETRDPGLAPELAGFFAMMPSDAMQAPMRVDVWVDADGLLRRITTQLDLSAVFPVFPAGNAAGNGGAGGGDGLGGFPMFDPLFGNRAAGGAGDPDLQGIDISWIQVSELSLSQFGVVVADIEVPDALDMQQLLEQGLPAESPG